MSHPEEGRPEGQKAQALLSCRERLLDAAEVLFAEHGFNGAPMREITRMAGTRLADINDHFGSKEGLFREVIVRRARLINADRLVLLERIPPVGSGADAIHAVVQAFASPLLAKSLESDGWRSYLRLLSQLTNTRSKVLELIADEFNPIAALFIDRLGAILPGLSLRQRINAYQFMVASAMAVFADTGRIELLSGGLEHSDSFQSHYDDMVHFVAGGVLLLGARNP